MSDFDRKDWDQDSKGPENIESNRKEQDPDRYKEVTDAEKTIVAEKEDASSVTETEAEDASDSNDTEDAKKKADLPYRNLSIFMESLELLYLPPSREQGGQDVQAPE